MHISYYDDTNDDLKYITGTTGAWSAPETLDSAGDVGIFTSLALDAAGNVHISYSDSTNGDLKYATTVSPVPVAEGLCFIATAAFGTPLAEEVEVLSRLRDEYLLTNESGQRFVALYNRHSPALAEFISEREWAKRLVRIALKPLVKMAELMVD